MIDAFVYILWWCEGRGYWYCSNVCLSAKNRFLKPQDLSIRKSIEINSFRLPWKLIAAVCDCRTFMNDDDFSLRSDLEDEISDHNRNIVIISITNFGIEIIGGIQYYLSRKQLCKINWRNCFYIFLNCSMYYLGYRDQDHSL